jgi:replicative DNA helicase
MITEAGAKKTFAELFDLRLRRDLAEKFSSAHKFIFENTDLKIGEVIAKTDAICNTPIKNYIESDGPIDIFEHLEEWTEERGENPVEEIGYEVPFPEFQKLYGGLRKGNIYAIVSRPGEGKSTFINELIFGACRLSNFQISGLCLDTEMFTTDTAFRILSSLSGVPFYFIETGLWRKNVLFEKKIRSIWALQKENKYRYHHYHVRNKGIDEVSSFARRWVKKNAKNGEAIIGYDYIKLTAEKIDKNWAEHQAIGEKIDRLKTLGEELKIPIVSAMQINRTGETQNRKSSDLTDDSSIIALSDRLQWFASFVAIFRRKTLDEIEADGVEFGTHKLIKTKGRFQGKDAPGHHDKVKRSNGKKSVWVSNYINFDVDNFKICEKGSLNDIVAKERERNDIQKNSENKDESQVDL